MSGLTPRQTSLIKLLMEEDRYRSSEYYAEKLNVSGKTILTDIKAVQDYLDQFQLKLQRKTGCGILLPGKARGNRELLNAMNQTSTGFNTLSTGARRKEILRRLLFGETLNVSITRLSEEFYVSRAGIVNDFKYIETWAQSQGLSLVHTPSGHSITGDEILVRKAIAKLIRELKTVDAEGPTNEKRSDRAVLEDLSLYFPAEEVELANDMVEHLESLCRSMIGEPYYSYLQNHFLICLSRVRKGHVIRSMDRAEHSGNDTYEELAKEMAKLIEQRFGVAMAATEKNYLYRYLISSCIGDGIDLSPMKDKLDATDLTSMVTEDLCKCVLSALRLNPGENPQLVEGLRLHIRPMLSRLRYNIRIQSQILEDVEADYGELLGLCRCAMWCICQKYSLKEVNISECSYLATFFQAMLEAKRSEEKVLLVSDSGFGTTQLLQTRLKQNFPDWTITGLVSARNLEDISVFNGANFVISTLALENIPVPQIMVSPLLTEKDVKNIRATLNASWMEERFSLKHLSDMAAEDRFELFTMPDILNRLSDHRSLYREEEIPWGHCIRVFMSLSTEDRVTIYRQADETATWLVVLKGMDYDRLLKLLGEAYQILCSATGRKLMERCYDTTDLKQQFSTQE